MFHARTQFSEIVRYLCTLLFRKIVSAHEISQKCIQNVGKFRPQILIFIFLRKCVHKFSKSRKASNIYE